MGVPTIESTKTISWKLPFGYEPGGREFEPRSTESAETTRSERSERAAPLRGEERSDE
jgi:hypothetical protein